VAQFPRPINPAHRTSSPQPSLFESHHDPTSALAREMGASSPVQAIPEPEEIHQTRPPKQGGQGASPYGQKPFANSWVDIPRIPHNEHPQHGMTQFCRTGPPSSGGPPSSFAPSDLSSGVSQNRPESRDSYSEYSNPSRNSYEQRPSQAPSPVKQVVQNSPVKKSSQSWFKSPFRRPSKPEKELQKELQQASAARPANRNTWGASALKKNGMDPNGNPARRSIFGGNGGRSASPDPIDPNSKIQLNIGPNVFDISQDASRTNKAQPPPPKPSVDDPYDPLVQALDELNRVTSKVSRSRDSADRHFQIPSPAPPRSPAGRASPLPPGSVQTPLAAAQRGTPPPSYDSPTTARSTLGAPPAAHTSKDMQNTTSRYVNQRRGVFEASPTANRGGGGPQQQQHIRATSPAPGRRSPQPGMPQQQYRPPSSQGIRPPSSQGFRAATAEPGNRARANTGTPQRPGFGSGSYGQRGGSPGMNGSPGSMGGAPPRARSPQPGWNGPGAGGPSRPASAARGDMALQVSRTGSEYGSMQGRGRPASQYEAATGAGAVSTRVRSKSVAEARQYTKDGRPILHHGKFAFQQFLA
jgi:hypothetical protein